MKWKKNQNLKPEVILKKINEIKQVNTDGSISFNAFEYQNSLAALYSMIEFPKQFISLQNTTLLRNAVANTSKMGESTKENVLKELKVLAKKAMSKKELKYNILTSISMSPLLSRKRIKIGNSNINFLINDYPKKYFSRNDTLKIINRRRKKSQQLYSLTPKHYTKVIISTKAKSELEAVNNALNDFDILRAVFSLFANPGMEIVGDENSPINKIRLGKFHTLHNSFGKNINPNRYWYEPNYKEEKIFNLKSSEMKIFEKNIKWCIKQLKNSKYSKQIEKALLRYVRALDEKDQNVALIQIWGALESLAAYEENNKSNLPKRCSFLYEDNEYHKQILEHLREYRNQSVHAGIRNEEVKQYCYQLQGYFLQLIIFHLQRVNEFNTLVEANHFLDQSSDISELTKKKNLIEKIIKFRQGK